MAKVRYVKFTNNFESMNGGNELTNSPSLPVNNEDPSIETDLLEQENRSSRKAWLRNRRKILLKKSFKI